MDEKTVNWLSEGPAWLKFAVEKQLLETSPDPGIALKDGTIVKLMGRLNDNYLGLPALRAGRLSTSATGNAYWDLFFLADVGFTASDLNLNVEIENVLNRQSPDGSYSLNPGMAENYYCQSAIPIATIARMGYRDDLRVRRYIKALLNARVAGGWHCYEWEKSGCPQDNLNALMLLGQYEEYRHNRSLAGALDLILEHWERRDEGWRKDGFGVGRRFRSLEYPATKYGILRVLDVLSLFPNAVKTPAFQSMLDFTRDKSTDGKYFAEAVSGSYADFDFGQSKEPSRWITFLVNRVEKRVSFD